MPTALIQINVSAYSRQAAVHVDGSGEANCRFTGAMVRFGISRLYRSETAVRSEVTLLFE
jgi:hypothetical protein